MNDEPKRWLDDGASSFERDLLSSADVDRAPSHALSRTLGSVQLAAAATLVAGTAAGTSASVGAVGVLKWVGVGVVSGLVSMVAVESVTPRAPQPSTPRDDRHATVVSATQAVVPDRESAKAQAPSAPAAVRSPRNSARFPREPQPVTQGPSAPGNRERDLVRETSLVSEASRRLDAGDPTRALALLDQYASEYPSGELRPEAAVVRVRALVATGRRKEAEQLAVSHAGGETGSAYSRAMQRALGETKAAKE